MPLQYLEARARAHLPHPHRPIVIATGEERTIRMKGNESDPVGVTPQRLEALARAHLACPHRRIVAPTGQASPIGAERHRPDPIRMSL